MVMKKETAKKQNKISTVNWIRGGILAAAAVLLVLGIFQGGHTDVRNKAIRICYECIGIG